MLREQEERDKKRGSSDSPNIRAAEAKQPFGVNARLQEASWQPGQPIPAVDGIESDHTIDFAVIPFAKPIEWLAKPLIGLIWARWLAVAAKGGIAAIEAGEYTITKTVAKNLATRPYINSPSTITNIMKSGKGVPDAFFKVGMNWKVPGTFQGSKGIFELGINPETNTIYHFLFKH
ncbi:hypothetical protein [Dyadobacter bucti]|uniref:hypothetical protein n=1 Tax=Dyadobacter bucti TaxID=2572203 RepID=UPI0011093F9F|nr:hypothetical protein [Dyadobacter bucti]